MQDFDVLVIGGAAGASWGGPAGWSAFVHVPSTNESKKLVGAQEDLPVNRADLLAIAAAIQWFHNRYGVNMDPKVRVLCCTDSVHLERAGRNPALRSGEDWLYISWFEQRGYQITWRWTSRDQCPAVYQEAENARRAFSSAVVRRPVAASAAGSAGHTFLDPISQVPG